MRTVIASTLTLLASFCAEVSLSSDFSIEVIRPESRLFEVILGSGAWAINISGEIPPDAGERFERFMKDGEVPSRISVYLDSGGGSLTGGLALGRAIRRNGMSTHIGRRVRREANEVSDVVPGVCMSACTFAYLGGFFRYISKDDLFGVHRFYFQNPVPDASDISQMLSASIATYITDMGVDITLMELSTRAGGDDMLILSHDQLRKLNVVNDGFTQTEWSMLSEGEGIYVRGERYTMYGHQKALLACIPDARQIAFFAIFETMNRDDELNMMSQIDLNIDGNMIDVSTRGVERRIVNGYQNIMFLLSGTEVEKISSANSIGLMMRGSSEAGMFLGFDGMKVEGGRKLIQGLINNCR